MFYLASALILITEAHGDFESFLSWEGSPWSYCINIADNQALHIQDALTIVDAKKIPAGLNSM